ncbi:hypothetical protein NDN08_005490 [Rhodosorus marinus]|uniref:Btz domain-containing protein n=1 Tax=Rhodosorus marinus TaxID=101924 RepID=A0AAV8V2M1_9RHOD|nr:hypothetical protein NDN08_005490 [Rhodosorus marinus]
MDDDSGWIQALSGEVPAGGKEGGEEKEVVSGTGGKVSTEQGGRRNDKDLRELVNDQRKGWVNPSYGRPAGWSRPPGPGPNPNGPGPGPGPGPRMDMGRAMPRFQYAPMYSDRRMPSRRYEPRTDFIHDRFSRGGGGGSFRPRMLRDPPNSKIHLSTENGRVRIETRKRLPPDDGRIHGKRYRGEDEHPVDGDYRGDRGDKRGRYSHVNRVDSRRPSASDNHESNPAKTPNDRKKLLDELQRIEEEMAQIKKPANKDE